MPNLSIASALVDTATKCLPAALSPSAPTIQARAALALVRVSCVMKVLEHTMTKVSAGSSVRVRSSSCVRSTLDTKCGVMSPLHCARNASHTNKGPKSEPPMPMLTTCRNFLPVMPSFLPLRTEATTFLSFWREALTSALMAGRPAKSERSAVCSTARFSVLLMGSPRNMAAMRSDRSTARANSSSSDKLWCVMRCREISSSQASCSTWQCCQRLGSAPARSRKCTLSMSLACAATAPQAGNEEFSSLMTRSYSCRLRVIIGKIPFDEALHTRFQVGGGPIADLARQRLHVGPRVGQIAQLHRQQILLRLFVQAMF